MGNALKDHLFDMGMAPPDGVVEEMFGMMETAAPEMTSYDDFFGAFANAYDTIAERYAALDSGGKGGRPLPDMDGIMGLIREEAKSDETIGEEFTAALLPFIEDNADMWA